MAIRDAQTIEQAQKHLSNRKKMRKYFYKFELHIATHRANECIKQNADPGINSLYGTYILPSNHKKIMVLLPENKNLQKKNNFEILKEYSVLNSKYSFHSLEETARLINANFNCFLKNSLLFYKYKNKK